MQKTFLFLLFLTSLYACQSQERESVVLNGLTMGTSYSVKIVPNGVSTDKNEIYSHIETILANINQSMSTYINDSELSRFNQSKSTDWQSLSSDLTLVIEHGNQVSLMTNGAFDITVGPLVNLWGFGPDPFNQEIPSESAIQTVIQHTAFNKLLFDKVSNRIAKSDPEVTIDLSGIAKGFAVDKIAQYLNEYGFKHYLIEIGGELIAKGTNTEEIPWQIGIEQAKLLSRSVQRIIGLDNIAMATSGDYRNYFEKDGIRYSHTINPSTGKPINHKLAAVTVLHSSAMHADALATAFMVSGPEKSLPLANQLGIGIYMIIKTDSGFEERYNDIFRPYLTN
jgi:thiamine biosynthesis lipoprotein